MDFKDLEQRIKKLLPSLIHKRIDEILKKLKIAYDLSKEFGDLTIGQYIEELILQLEEGLLKPIPMMRKLQNLYNWAEMLSKGLNLDVKPQDLENIAVINKLWFMYMAEIGAGHAVNLKNLLNWAKAKELERDEPKYNDITSTNIIVTLGEILSEGEEYFEKYIPGSANLLHSKKYDEIDISNFNSNSLGSNIEEIKMNLKRHLEIVKIFYPIYQEIQTIISLMPVLLTMLCEDIQGLDKIRDDCNNIFMEVSMGAELERIALSLKEKVGKRRSIEDLQVNAKAIRKNFKKIEDALNIKVFSYLRQLKVQTIIEDKLFQDAKEYGLDLTGLNSIFGKIQAPHEFKDMTLEATRKFSNSIIQIKKLIVPKLSEEIGIEIRPNLHSLESVISEFQENIEKYYLLVPAHIGPIYSGVIHICAETIDNLTRIFSPLRENLLKQIIINETRKEEFYNNVEQGIKEIHEDTVLFGDFFDLGLKLESADQNLALQFSKQGDNKDLYETDYSPLFENSIRNVKRMLAMKTLSQEGASSTMERISHCRSALIEFKKKWRKEDIHKILENGRNH